jgi:hypothetical protein
MCLSTEWDTLHHVDVAWLELELKVVGLVRMFSMLRAENSRRILSVIASGTGVELPLNLVDSN